MSFLAGPSLPPEAGEKAAKLGSGTGVPRFEALRRWLCIGVGVGEGLHHMKSTRPSSSLAVLLYLKSPYPNTPPLNTLFNYCDNHIKSPLKKKIKPRGCQYLCGATVMAELLGRGNCQRVLRAPRSEVCANAELHRNTQAAAAVCVTKLLKANMLRAEEEALVGRKSFSQGESERESAYRCFISLASPPPPCPTTSIIYYPDLKLLEK